MKAMRPLAGALILCLSPLARADTELEALRHRLETLERQQQQTLAELDQLRAQRAGEPGAASPAAAASGTARSASASGSDALDLGVLAGDSPLPRRIDFHGHLAFAYFGFEQQSLVPGTGDDANVTGGSLTDLSPASSFSETDVTLFVGVPLGESVYAAAEVEYEQGGEDIEVDQAFLQWDLAPEERFALRLGKFYAPFGIERFYQNAPENALVDRPAPYIHIIPGTYSDTGIELLGQLRLFEGPEIVGRWELALVNGLGPELFDSARAARQFRDNNSSKALGGRIGLGYDRWLELGLSALAGEYDDGDEDDYRLLGADLRASWGRFLLRGEYVYSRVDRPEALDALGRPCSDPVPRCRVLTAPFTPLGGSLERRGWYLQGSYRQRLSLLGGRELEYVIRYDALDEDDTVRDLLDARRVALGLVYHPFSYLRMKLQYELTDEDADEIDNNAFLFETSVNW
jgi:hypothetical protein